MPAGNSWDFNWGDGVLSERSENLALVDKILECSMIHFVSYLFKGKSVETEPHRAMINM